MRNRSVVEIMVVVLTFVVAISIVGLGFMIIWVEIDNPQADTDRVVATLMSLLSSILGALLGLIAGRATASDLHRRGDGRPNGLDPP